MEAGGGGGAYYRNFTVCACCRETLTGTLFHVLFSPFCQHLSFSQVTSYKLTRHQNFRGTKGLVSVNICSVEGNSAGILVRKVSAGFFCKKLGKMNAYYFRRDKTAVLGAVKAQLPFSEGKYQLLNPWTTIPFPTIFYHLNF